ncbi:TIGR04388 family protein, partial [Leptospira alexanderi]|uniref:TIGR04388 family protein n=1 Tax=Leptospira alexanderi TaxID=100053 RepID=UPI001BB006DE
MFRPAGRNIELPESPVSEKREQKSKVEYNEILKYERYFLRKPPSFLTPNSYLLAPGMTSVATHYLRGYGVISHDEMNRFNQDIRTTVNDLKHKSEKEAIATWNADEIQSYGLAVKEYGKTQGWSQETIEAYSKAAMEYATREQAKSALAKQTQVLDTL